MNNDKGEIMVTWSDDDDDLFREEEEAEKDERTGPLYQGKAAALAKEDVSLLATSPVRWRKSVAVIPAAKNVPQDVSQDLRTEIVQLSTSTATISSSSNSNNKNHSRFQPSSGTNTDAPDHIEWGDDLRNDIARLETSKPALAAGDDLRNAINSMTRKMKDLESPETRAVRHHSGYSSEYARTIYPQTVCLRCDCSSTKAGQLSTVKAPKGLEESV
ncbi:hypothetical protein BGX23_011566 [Mortierella sp. AD031]|nr:hypothetical protein BGX23_011566 [Mortierella sp. AD031]